MFISKITQNFFGRFIVFCELVKSKQYCNNPLWKYKIPDEKFSKMFYSVVNKAYQRKIAMHKFWTSRNLNVRNEKGKQTGFAKAPRKWWQGTFSILIHMQISSVLTNLLLVFLVLILIVSWQPFKSWKTISAKANIFNVYCVVVAWEMFSFWGS